MVKPGGIHCLGGTSLFPLLESGERLFSVKFTTSSSMSQFFIYSAIFFILGCVEYTDSNILPLFDVGMGITMLYLGFNSKRDRKD